MDYRSEIDGLRAIAVLSVIFFHAGFQGFSGGFIGVDIFFVISGYLITSIILKDLSQKSFSILTFYERRVRRIIPALYTVTLCTVPFAFIWMTPADYLDFSKSLVSVPTFTSNFLFFSESGYFDQSTDLKPFFHTWSLGVEEQYYIFFPVFLMLLWNKNKEKVSILFLSIIFISLIASEVFLYIDRMFSFYMLPTRLWELLIGSSVAYYQLNYKTKFLGSYSSFFEISGLTLILFSIFFFDKNSMMPGLLSLFPILGISLLLIYSHKESFIGKLLSLKLFTFIGLISYSLYLWHQPIFSLLNIYRFSEVKPGMYVGAIIIIFLLSFLTWKFIEKPFRKRSNFSQKVIFKYFSGFSVLIIFIGITGILTNGFDKIYKSRLSETERIFYKNVQENMFNRNNSPAIDSLGECILHFKDEEIQTKLIKCSEKYGKGKVIFGDSHKDNVVRALQYSKNNQFLISIGTYHCHAYHASDNDPRSECDFDYIDDFLNKNRDYFDFVIYNQLGSYFIRNSNSLTLNNVPIANMREEILSIDTKRVNQTLLYLQRLSKNNKVLWLSSWVEPLYPMHNPRKVSKMTDGEIDFEPKVESTFKRLEDFIQNEIKVNNLDLDFVSLMKEGKSYFRILDGKCVMFNDTNHLSSCGERIAGPIINNLIRRY